MSLDGETRRNIREALFLIAACVATLLGFAAGAHCEEPPGVREEWSVRPSAAEWERVAGEHGFVVALSPERWDFVLSRLQGALEEQESLEARIKARDELIGALRIQLAAEQASRQTCTLALSSLSEAQQAILERTPPPRKRWPWLVAGLVTGAGSAWIATR